MKQLIRILSLVMIIFVTACSNKPSTQSQVVILVDNTDKCESRESMLSTSAVLDIVNNNGTTTWKEINAVTLNRDTTLGIQLPDDATSLQIKDAVDPFTQMTEGLRKKFLGPCAVGTEGSSVYKPVCETIAKLSKSNTDATLIIVSDMIENSKYGNFYKEIPYEQVKKQLSSSGDSLVKNSNVHVIILFDPKGDPKKEQQFDRSMKIWKQLFDEAGIDFENKANL